MRHLTKAIPVVALAVLFALAPASGSAQYPTKSVRLVVGYAAGGPADALARTIALRMTPHLGQTMIVENRGGADANIATEAVARAVPDGHTLLLGTSGLPMNVSLYPKFPIDPVKDLSPISLIGGSPNLVAVHLSLPAKTLAEFIALAKAKKGQLFYGSTSSPTHLATEMLNIMAGIQTVRVPYKGAGLAIPALLAGETQFMVSSIGTLLPQVKGGKVRGLAVTSAKRSPLAPEIPTVDEAGVRGFSATTWYGLNAPPGTPAAIIERLNTALRKVLAEPESMAPLLLQGLEANPMTPKEYGEFIRAETAKWASVVKESGIRIE